MLNFKEYLKESIDDHNDDISGAHHALMKYGYDNEGYGDYKKVVGNVHHYVTLNHETGKATHFVHHKKTNQEAELSFNAKHLPVFLNKIHGTIKESVDFGALKDVAIKHGYKQISKGKKDSGNALVFKHEKSGKELYLTHPDEPNHINAGYETEDGFHPKNNPKQNLSFLGKTAKGLHQHLLQIHNENWDFKMGFNGSNADIPEHADFHKTLLKHGFNHAGSYKNSEGKIHDYEHSKDSNNIITVNEPKKSHHLPYFNHIKLNNQNHFHEGDVKDLDSYLKSIHGSIKESLDLKLLENDKNHEIALNKMSKVVYSSPKFNKDPKKERSVMPAKCPNCGARGALRQLYSPQNGTNQWCYECGWRNGAGMTIRK